MQSAPASGWMTDMKHIVGTLAIFVAGFVVALNLTHLMPPGTYEAAWWKVYGCVIAAIVVSATALKARD